MLRITPHLIGLRTATPAIALVLAMLLAACGDGESDAGDSELVVVATTTILGDVVGNVVGDDARVVVLTPEGADPHDFQPSSSQVAAIEVADLVVANGLLLEAGMADILASAIDDGGNVLQIAPALDPLPFGFDAGDDHDGDNQNETGDGALDPHVWFDPLRMGEAARLIAGELAAMEPAIDWMASAESYAAELTALDEEIVTILGDIPQDRRRLVTNHDALGYFADRYGFEIVGTVVPGGSTLGDPSSEALADLVALMRAEGVSAIFADATQPAALAEAVAAELGTEVEVVSLYTGSLGESGSGADTLIGMLRTDARRIATALGG